MNRLSLRDNFQVHNFRKLTDRLERSYGIYFESIKEKPKDISI